MAFPYYQYSWHQNKVSKTSMLQLIPNSKNCLELIIENSPRAYVYVLGTLQTIKCMLQLKVNVVTNWLSKKVYFCQLWYTIYQTVVIYFLSNLDAFIYSGFFLKMKNTFLYRCKLSFFKIIPIL